MPGRGNGRGRDKDGRDGGNPLDVGDGRAGKNDGGVGMAAPESPGQSEQSPGHLKAAAGSRSARDFAPGHGGTPPGQGRNSTENATETPELDSFDREG